MRCGYKSRPDGRIRATPLGMEALGFDLYSAPAMSGSDITWAWRLTSRESRDVQAGLVLPEALRQSVDHRVYHDRVAGAIGGDRSLLPFHIAWRGDSGM